MQRRQELIRLGNELTARREAKTALLESPRAGQSRSERNKASYVAAPEAPGKVT
jgi:hypothetical protein